MELLIVTLSIALTALLLATIAIFLYTDESSKIFVCKIRKLRKQNTALRRKCRKLKVSAEMPYYIIDLRGKIQEEEIKSLKLQLQSQDKLKIENLELKLFVKDLEQKLEEYKIQSEKSNQ